MIHNYNDVCDVQEYILVILDNVGVFSFLILWNY